MEAYSIFSKTFLNFCEAKKYNLTESFGNSGDSFIDNIGRNLIGCKHFLINDKVKKLLCLTKTPNINDEVMLPFDSMFIDVIFTREELAKLGIKIRYRKIMGLIVCKGQLITEDENVIAGTGLRITMLSNPDETDYIWFDTFTRNVNVLDEYKDFNISVKEFDEADKRSKNFIHKFVLNFLNFINDPEVEFVRNKSDEVKNRKRINRGQFPNPDFCPIRITGKLKVYLDKVSDKSFSYSYRFWVRGHFRTLRHPRYGDNVGKRQWIAPQIRGKGILINKRYSIK
jgi:hypothetical protein